ncbi:hypothetical protein [Kribbella swartbergensis]
MGIEGLVVKGAVTRYTPGRRDAWVKVKHRETPEIVSGGALGPIIRPDVVIAGLYNADGEFVIVGRTVPLTADSAWSTRRSSSEGRMASRHASCRALSPPQRPPAAWTQV